MNQFLGDSPWRVLVRLLLLSLVVGVVLDWLDLHPLRLWNWLRSSVLWAIDSGLFAFESLGGYLLMGALVVVPIFLIARLIRMGR